MSELVQVRKKAQVTLPLSVRKKLNIEEGDFLDVQVRDGEMVLKVKKLVDKDQAWFWTKRWQEGEKEAEEDIKAGRGITFPDAQSAIEYLHAEAKVYDAQRSLVTRDKDSNAYQTSDSVQRGTKPKSETMLRRAAKSKKSMKASHD